MLARILTVTLSAFLLGAIATQRALRNENSLARRERWTKYAVYFVIVHALIFAALAGRRVLLPLFAAILVAGGRELWRVARTRRVASMAAYCALAIALIGFLWTAPVAVVIYVFIVTAAFDGFSQVVGNNFGRVPLAPLISPRKTIEGALGGLLGGVMIGVLLRPLMGIDIAGAALTSTFLCGAALSGDLLASRFKRLNRVKDFGASIPAHGGVLDRFDSFLIAGCAWWLAALVLSA